MGVVQQTRWGCLANSIALAGFGYCLQLSVSVIDY